MNAGLNMLSSSLYLARGARRWRKAWGGAERNPRSTTSKNNQAREACDSAHAAITDDEAAVAHSAGSALVFQPSWGSAPLHPRLYAIATLRGLIQNTFPA